MSMLETFAARLAQDPRLRCRLQAVEGETRGEVMEGISRVARAYGLELSPDELEAAFGGSVRPRELTSLELKKISGGGAGVNPALVSVVSAKLGERARSLLAGG